MNVLIKDSTGKEESGGWGRGGAVGGREVGGIVPSIQTLPKSVRTVVKKTLPKCEWVSLHFSPTHPHPPTYPLPTHTLKLFSKTVTTSNVALIGKCYDYLLRATSNYLIFRRSGGKRRE